MVFRPNQETPLEHVSKPAFEPRSAIVLARHKPEDEKYRDISNPRRSVVAHNHASQSRNEVLRPALRRGFLCQKLRSEATIIS